MVGLLSLTVMLVLARSVAVPINTEAAEYSGTFGMNRGLSWSYDESTKTITVTGEDETVYGNVCSEWSDLDSKVEKIKFFNCTIKGSMISSFQNSSVSEIDF